MPYASEGIDQRAEVLQGAGTDTLAFWPKVDAGDAPTISAAFVTILDPNGTEKVARTAATIASGQISRAQAWAVADYPIGEDYHALWEYTVGGVTYSDRQYFDVVKNKLFCLIGTRDLEELYPNLTKHLVAIGESDASKFIRRAWSTMLDRIRSGGNRPSLILDNVRLINPAIQLAAHFTCAALARETDDIWDKRADGHMKLYHELFGGLGSLKYDKDEDARASSEEKKQVNRRLFGV